MSANNSQGIYTQLPQSLSDSDSETEINDLKEIKHQNERKLQNGLQTNGFMLSAHVVRSKRGFYRMSRARKIAFIFSIFLCFLVVIIFLWVLPCSSNETCPAKVGSWKAEHEGIELNGRINVITGPYKNSVHLALLAKKSINNAETHSGAIALKTANGAMNWFVPQVRAPTHMDCDLLDADRDGVTDCLLLGEMGLTAVEPLSGEIIWHGHNTKMILQNMDPPALLPDLSYDGVPELITVTDWHNAQHNVILVICGSTGQLLAYVVVHMCDEISDFKYDDRLVIFGCKNITHDYYFKMPVGDLQRRTASNSSSVQATRIQYEPEDETEFILHDRKLIVENTGDCPDCSTNIALLDIRELRPGRLLGWTKPKTYAMRPIQFSFKASLKDSEKMKGNGDVNGFIMKLWQWPDITYNSNSTIQRTNVTEKILLISFTDSDLQVINISLVQITQLCFPNGLDCQPSLANRNDSLLLTDLDFDGAQELINYSSTYKCGESDESCYLVSKMEVVQLETEMAKLYAK